MHATRQTSQVDCDDGVSSRAGQTGRGQDRCGGAGSGEGITSSRLLPSRCRPSRKRGVEGGEAHPELQDDDRLVQSVMSSRPLTARGTGFAVVINALRGGLNREEVPAASITIDHPFG